MAYKTGIERRARRALKRLPVDTGKILWDAIDLLSRHPFPNGCLKLSGTRCTWRLRVNTPSGQKRIIYDFDNGILRVLDIRDRNERTYKF